MSSDTQLARQRMVDQQLRARGIDDERVLAAMLRVPRECFVSPQDAPLAYDDCALAIDCSQTISQPYIVAVMTQALSALAGQRVLELGTGSGYQAAVLASLGLEVFSIERHPQLARTAREHLNLAGTSNVQIRVGDGRHGWPEEAPFDRVIITAATDQVPDKVWQQLAEGGLLVAPLGDNNQQTLTTMRKIGGRPVSEPLLACRFVPLVRDIAAQPP